MVKVVSFLGTAILLMALSSTSTQADPTSPSTPYEQLIVSMKPMSFWLLDETNSNIAYDSVGGDNGVYTNVTLGLPGTYPPQLAAQFGSSTQSFVSLPNLDLSVTNGGNGEFTIAAWVQASSNVEGAAGIVARGYGNGDEEFGLACGANGNAFQFFIRNAQNRTASVANSSVYPDNHWHLLVGVCDQANSIITLYVDGTNAAQAQVTPGTGIHYSSYQGSIGARASNTGTPEDLQFLGLIDDVAIFTNVLSAGQIAQLYSTLPNGPAIWQQPVAQQHVQLGGTITNTVVTRGTNIVYQWYGPAGAIANATNSSLVLSNFDLSDNGFYYVTASNAWLTVQSSNALIFTVPPVTAAYPLAVLALNPLAYWRLDETNGTIAYDYANNNSGTYNNVLLGQPGYGTGQQFNPEPGELAAQFVSNGTPSYVSIPTIDMAVPYDRDAEFSIAAWVKASPSVANGAGIIAKGAGSGDEEFCMDCGGTSNAFRFYVHDTVGNSWVAASSVVPDNHWHLLVGVCDERGNAISLYIDGTIASSVYMAPLLGIHSSSVPAGIGSRESYAGQPFNQQFIGELNDVAIFNTNLSSAQIGSLYTVGIGLPIIQQQPAPVLTAIDGASVTDQIVASGPDLNYQWYGPNGAIAGATNSTLVLSNATYADAGTYYAVVFNPNLSLQSSNVTLQILPAGRYQSSFGSYPSGTTAFADGSQLFSTALGSVAAIVANPQEPTELQLTESGDDGVTSAFELPALNPDAPIYAFSAKWNSQVYGPFQEAADGFSFNFGQLISSNLLNGGVESGYPTGLCFSVQTFSGNNPGFYVRVNGNTLASQSYYPPSEWGNDNPARHYFEVDWNYTNGMSVWIDHQVIFANVPTPGFVPQAGDQFVWAARCGGISEEVRLANIALVTGGNLASVQGQSPYFADPNTLADYAPSNAFVTDPSTVWETATNFGYLGATVSPSVPLTGYALTSTGPTSDDPATWTLQGSSDGGITWENVAGTTDYFLQGSETRAWLTTDSTSVYGAYRLNVTTNNGGPDTALQQLAFYQMNTVSGPSVISEPASQVSLSGAQLNAQANAGAAPTAAWFQWGTSASYGNTTSIQNIGGTNLTFSALLSGLTPNVFYHSQAVISNQYGVFYGADEMFSTVINPVVFSSNSANWSSNQSGAYTTPTITNNVLNLTDGAGNEARSVFFQMPQYVGAFKASFTYQDVGGGGADGAAFVLQNDPRGASALGGVGGSLGYGITNPITPSAALELNIYSGSGQIVGYTFLTNGLLGAGGANGNYHAPGSVNLGSGHPITISMNYANSRLALSFTDAVANASFSTNLNVPNLTNVLGGSTAYIGFTAGDGGIASTQIITNFVFVSVPTETVALAGGQAMISWPAAIGGFTLQQNSNLATTNWVDTTNLPTVVNGQYQFAVPLTATNEFYRLKLP